MIENNKINYIIYDCEVIKCIPAGTMSGKYEYCRGWNDFGNMGISVVGVYISTIDKYEVLTLDPSFGKQAEIDADKLAVLAQNFKTIGFNSKSFDDNLCAAYNIKIKTFYDVLKEVRIAAFGSSRWQDTPKGFKYSLDSIAHANGMAKAFNGAMAPQLWQDKRYQEVADYCINDVQVTKNILDFGLQGKLVDPNTGRFLKLRNLS